MSQDKLTGLAKQAGIDFEAPAFVTWQLELERFAELVRNEALDEAVNVALSHYDGYQISEDIRSLK